ncbi:mycothiol system anti-sigma-R factor [Actinacidiphila epipremni]|uniref:Mycothiol system anti-sigma-R factor n=1 Tax=Actinacidiphila epipremni TaxID=2053013 RepID=A0ABX0ZKK1_9ACTN|nr:mycothiol system anti-sigma-R factor [Actinacidiphila epipremni]NJP42389.1 mycothiol system anti-sigma-R factor [Actinacidiphila epipremni]
MSCGNAHETDCSEVLDHLYEYLDNEMSDESCTKFRQHFEECHPCLEKYGLEQAVKKLVKRCCGSDEVPTDLRSKVMMRIETIRAGEAAAASASSASPSASSSSASSAASTSAAEPAS